jgi:hypothetical protein
LPMVWWQPALFNSTLKSSQDPVLDNLALLKPAHLKQELLHHAQALGVPNASLP